MNDTTYPFDAWLAEGFDDFDMYEDDYLAARAARFGASEADIRAEDGEHDPCGIFLQQALWDHDYWRATYEEAMQ